MLPNLNPTLAKNETTADMIRSQQWNFDGSSTGQAPGDNSDVYLKPVAVYPDPFRTEGGNNILVLAECWMSDGTPNKFNHRHEAAKLMEKHASHVPWFGLEQEYTLLDLNERPFGWVSLLDEHRASIERSKRLTYTM